LNSMLIGGYVLLGIFFVVVVLLQSGRGSDAVVGGGPTTQRGIRGDSGLRRLTLGLMFAIFVLAITLSVVFNVRKSSVGSQMAEPATATSEEKPQQSDVPRF